LLERERRVLKKIFRFFRILWKKIQNDDVIFLASGLAFNILMCLIPILLLLVYLVGILFQSANTLQFVDKLLVTVFPNQPHALTIRQLISNVLSDIVLHRKSF